MKARGQNQTRTILNVHSSAYIMSIANNRRAIVVIVLILDRSVAIQNQSENQFFLLHTYVRILSFQINVFRSSFFVRKSRKEESTEMCRKELVSSFIEGYGDFPLALTTPFGAIGLNRLKLPTRGRY